MEALMTAEVPEDQDGMVIEEVRPGYKLKEQVVRPAGVRVGVARKG
jgi:molecular chaperone GrpE (heat shock protein)